MFSDLVTFTKTRMQCLPQKQLSEQKMKLHEMTIIGVCRCYGQLLEFTGVMDNYWSLQVLWTI